MINWVKNYKPLISDKHLTRNLVLFIPVFILGFTCMILSGILTRFPNNSNIVGGLCICGGILIVYEGFFLFDLTMSRRTSLRRFKSIVSFVNREFLKLAIGLTALLNLYMIITLTYYGITISFQTIAVIALITASVIFIVCSALLIKNKKKLLKKIITIPLRHVQTQTLLSPPKGGDVE
jgi:hypothetical protein